MPRLAQHQSNLYTKLLIEGDSGSGKTGALCSLVKAGYWLGVLDFDNGLETLKTFVYKECPENIGNIEYVTLRDTRKPTTGGFSISEPKAIQRAMKLLNHWKYTDDTGTEVDEGKPSEWGPDRILVIDSLTFLADAAFAWCENLIIGQSKGKYDERAVYGSAQNMVEDILDGVTGDAFKTNVIVISHIKYVDNPDGTRKGYPTAVGSALSPIIPRYFNSVALCQTAAGGKRTIQTAATAMIDLKNPKPFEMLPSYPIDTGLAAFFAVLREAPQSKAKTIPLRRA